MSALAPLSPHSVYPSRSSADSVNLFYSRLDDTMLQLGLLEKNWNNPLWVELVDFVSQDVLNDIYSKKEDVIKLFGLLKPNEARCSLSERALERKVSNLVAQGFSEGQAIALVEREADCQFHFTSRERPKNYNRLVQKLADQEESIKKGWTPRYFQAYNDLLAFSIPLTNLKQDLSKVVSHLTSTAQQGGGCIELRKNKNTHMESIENGKYTDIVQFAYVYLPNIGIVEFQLLHPFARYTFTRNSELRENPALKAVMPNLFANKFYDLVKTFILDDANGCFAGDQNARNIRHQEILDRAVALHQSFGNGEIPQDLKDILLNL